MSERTIAVQRDLRSERQAAAKVFRDKMSGLGTLVVRLLSSPGSGKTALLEKTAQWLSREFSVGVLVGDVETERDANRLAPFAPTVQITTGGACHLELPLVERAYPKLHRQRLDFLFLEDIGNLICPASHDLGEHLRVILLSTTEGDDKPGKYPKAFRSSQVMVVTKVDLLPYVPFSVEHAQADALRIQPQLRCLSLSALRGEGMDAWLKLLIDQRQQLLAGSLVPS